MATAHLRLSRNPGTRIWAFAGALVVGGIVVVERVPAVSIALVGTAAALLLFGRIRNDGRGGRTTSDADSTDASASFERDATIHCGVRHELEEQAIDGGDIVAFLQPIVDLRTGRTVAAEAMARWIHPSTGAVELDDVVSAADAAVVSRRLDSAILDDILSSIESLEHRSLEIRISMHVSDRGLADPAMAGTIARAIAEHCVDPSRLIIEFPSTAVLGNRATIECLRAVRSLGVLIALDDSSTGGSSLGLLQDLPLDMLRIDGGSVGRLGGDDLHERSLRSVVEQAHAMGMTVVAEDVETQAQAAALRTMGCDQAQGVRWAPALPVTELTSRMLIERTANDARVVRP